MKKVVVLGAGGQQLLVLMVDQVVDEQGQLELADAIGEEIESIVRVFDEIRILIEPV
jgi:hypothetical protein